MNPSGQQDQKPHKEDRLLPHEVMFNYPLRPEMERQMQSEMQRQMQPEVQRQMQEKLERMRRQNEPRQNEPRHHRAWALVLVFCVLALAVWYFGFVSSFGWLGYLLLFIVLIVTLFVAFLLW